MDKLPLLVFGVAVLVIPILLLFWSTSTERGRKAYERKIRESEAWPKMGGLVPLKPPRSALARWAYAHPWLAAALVAVAESTTYYALGRLVFNNGHGEAIASALYFALEGFVILGLLFREHWKHYGRSTREAAK